MARRETVICRECGKETLAELDYCSECGARRRKTRSWRELEKQRIEPPTSEVGRVTDAVRMLPKPPKEAKPRSSARRSRWRKEPAPRDQRTGRQGRSRVQRTRLWRPGSRQRTSAAAVGQPDADGPQLVIKRVHRRKVYRYGASKRTKFKYGTELRAMLVVLIVGLAIVLMCHMQRAEGASLGTPGAGGKVVAVGRADQAVCPAPEVMGRRGAGGPCQTLARTPLRTT